MTQKISAKSRDFPESLTVIELKTCRSTNDWLKKYFPRIKDQLPVLLIAEKQSGGRGRGNHAWHSTSNKGIYASFAFQFLQPGHLHYLALISALSVIDAVRQATDVACDLKWPNDVYQQNKKLAGILIETRLLSEKKIFCIAGIGININHWAADFPAELSQKATSLRLITGHAQDKKKLARLLAAYFISWLGRLQENKIDAIIASANQAAGKFLGTTLFFHDADTVQSGIFRGIDPSGGLILENPAGQQTLHFSGEIAVE